MGIGTLLSLVLSIAQLSLLTIAKEVDQEFQDTKASNARQPIFPASVNGPSEESVYSMDPSSADKRWKEMAVWGKRSDDDQFSKRWKQMAVWGKRDNEQDLEKKWKQMSVWGKRGDDLDLDKKWKEMAVWGKRAENLDLEKKWKEMAVWGKRDGDLDLDKKWKQMSVWGKRDGDLDLDKKWKQMSVWGKRDLDMDMDKRWKEMAVWGKRNLDSGLVKRWREMAVWGKRNGDVDLDKKWKQMAVWGKRTIDPELVKSLRLHILNKQAQNQNAVPENNVDLESLVETGVGVEKGSKPETEWNSSNRDLENDAEQEQEMDKKWQEMAVWGKRDANSLSQDTLEQLANGLKATKRSSGWESEQERWARVRERMRQLSNKRPSWSDTGLSSWGKRSGTMAAAGSPISS